MRFFWILFLTIPALAQTRRGPVLDAQSRQPLAGVSVSADRGVGTRTDVGGFFSVPDSTQTVRLSFVGYAPLLVDLRTDSMQTFLLRPTETELETVVIRAYETNRSALEVPAAVATLGRRELERFAPVSLVPAMNTLPGVRMEERSPGSYRLSLRGSTLRSPFGVRNVKVYFNDIPFTDAGGNTYLQSFDWPSIGRIEVLKGPAGSLYGAGTGGVVLLESPRPTGNSNRIRAGLTVGSFGLRQYELGGESGAERQQITAGYSRQESDGYREQSALRREVLNLNSRFFLEKQTISVSLLASDLGYQTPGGLTRAQFEADPRQARPGAAGAVAQQAAFRTRTIFLGGSHQFDPTPRLSLRSSLYTNLVRIENPAIRNWERRLEQGVGGRATAQYRLGTDARGVTLTAGGEFQTGTFSVRNWGNRRGAIDTLQSDEELRYQPWSAFAQAEWRAGDWSLTTALSLNSLALAYARFYRPVVAEQRRTFAPELSPRIALLKKIGNHFSAYASLSSGFSPPTVQEVRPSEGTFNQNLNPERGTNYELGIRGETPGRRLTFEVIGYAFRLREAIVIRRTDDGAEFFANAGGTRQDGVEASAAWRVFDARNSMFDVRNSSIWSSYAFQPYRFGQFVTSGGDFSGKQLTGTPRHTLNLGADLVLRAGPYWNLTAQRVDAVFVNDANTEQAPAYQLLGSRIGYRNRLGKYLDVDAFVGIDNALDQTYTPGPDLNAVGGRYFNAAPGRNWYGGLRVGYGLGGHRATH
jgi:iron complex outermembrane receptor protein